MSKAWRPLWARGKEAARFDQLHDGVPAWMRQSFWQWAVKYFMVEADFATRARTGHDHYFDNDLLMAFERRCHIPVDHSGIDLNDSINKLWRSVELQEAELDLADFLLSQPRTTLDRVKELEAVLKESGSAWKVDVINDGVGLVKRVPQAVQDMVDRAAASPGAAGHRLAEAWSAVFGRSPDPDKGYLLAVQAVEDAAAPRVTPTDREPTLGKVINTMRGQKNWTLPMEKTNPNAAPGVVLLSAMRLLWVGHKRHGGGEYARVTQAEAEVAVLTAATLVQLFESGAVSRV